MIFNKNVMEIKDNGKLEDAECLRLLKVAAGRYGQALANCPTCPLLLHNYARAMHTLGTYSADKVKKYIFNLKLNYCRNILKTR